MKKILTAIFLFSTLLLSAQNQTNKVEKQMFKANLLLTPGVEYEVGVSENATLDFRLGTGLAYVKSNNDEDYGVFLTFEGAYRYYYNFEKRANKGKNTSGNSANYLAMTTYIAHGDPILGNLDTDIDYVGQVGPVWGFQRTYNSGFNLGLELGVGYAFNDNDQSMAPIVNFRLGWAFGK
ncbi:DUF3575 domain-containing protein [Aquimarina algiphila]|uniref:DUF3575 domain-containing protein n=1 Tax=Aquimarina algiphila TaxID=2047982 RepID=UPI002492BFD4|nr:DUF3575 domain-containing protein [Aquimarina algiphila]